MGGVWNGGEVVVGSSVLQEVEMEVAGCMKAQQQVSQWYCEMDEHESSWCLWEFAMTKL